MPGTLDGAIGRSPHARPVSIDAKQAERRAGVHVVVMREDRGHLNTSLDPESYGTEGEASALIIALEEVRDEGEPVGEWSASGTILSGQLGFADD